MGDRQLRQDVLDVLGHLISKSQSGKYVLIVHDPTITVNDMVPMTIAYGPYEGPAAVELLEKLETAYASDPELRGVQVVMIPWEKV